MTPAHSATAGIVLSGSPTSPSVFFTQRHEHDPSDHRQVQVRVRVAGDPVLLGSARRALKRRSATTATTSKYAHQKQAAITIPKAAARSTPASSSSPARPAPTATIDSPRAMMMISA